ncbi:hypothetical protein ACFQ1E_07875 [Sphingomonas canadensis]|uniref:Tail specific protease domain-containing protein n=1 Tax=Sphingomonas canadensis TaxID=1219257 RepID=A0ABW3H4K4_9SPHN|nr:hypothetical protein [Sphingomonas canadensis]MCW3835954.1 hypothetical protein [Sphingomonas canadensis]
MKREDVKDWQAALRADASAFHDAILDSHPGPFDSENPGFGKTLERAYALALSRAKPGIGYREYYWAMTEFANAFDDGHLGVGDRGPGYKWDFIWPGFAVAYRGGAYVVAHSEGGAGMPAVGAVLEKCDGKRAAALAEEKLAPLVGRWSLTSTRERTAPRLFLRSDNPFRAPVRRCTFLQDGKRIAVKPDWQPIDSARRSKLIVAITGARANAGIGMEPLGAKGYAFNLGSFDTDPEADTTKALTALVAQTNARGDAVAEADLLLFDLRGNDGGSSGWMLQIAQAIWGKRYTDAKAEDGSYPDYRISDANIANYRGAYEDAKARGDAYATEWLARVVAAMEGAKAAGRPFWSARNPDAGPLPDAGPNRVKARVFVFTDSFCASACLDAVDLLTALGAIQVGQETSADTLYMDIRDQDLPSGVLRAWIPTKVYRGRARGSNMPATPLHRWTGSLEDTAGIRAWVAGLPAR